MRVRSVKETLVVTVMTLQGYRIVGDMHVAPGTRLTDEANREHTFLPLTDATVFTADGRQLTKVNFLVVNKNNIVLVAPTPKNAQATP